MNAITIFVIGFLVGSCLTFLIALFAVEKAFKIPAKNYIILKQKSNKSFDTWITAEQYEKMLNEKR